MPLPRVLKVRQTFPRPRVGDVDEALNAEWQRDGISSSIRPGTEVAITAGSRGIADIAPVVRGLVRLVRDAGASPFIIPAMGSHGGATAEGQVKILATLGVTEEFCGAPIRSSMEVVEIGATEHGMPVYVDRHAHGADGVIVVGRVKAHTDFRGPVESGLHKMCTIGLGKHEQALAVHALGLAGLRDHMAEVGRYVAESGHVLFGVAIVENGYEESAVIEAVPPALFREREEALLKRWFEIMPRLPIEDIDILMVDRMGKNYSGCGMDTNVIGRMRTPGLEELPSPRVKWLIISALADESHGNATGMGLADLTTRRLFDRIDFGATNENVLTSTFLDRAKVPMVRSDDRDALRAAIRCNWGVPAEETRFVRIPNTLHLEDVQLSENLLQEAIDFAGVEPLTEPAPLQFGPDGYLLPFDAGETAGSRHEPWDDVDDAPPDRSGAEVDALV
jgi:Lactate racemase N-terminal domain